MTCVGLLRPCSSLQSMRLTPSASSIFWSMCFFVENLEPQSDPSFGNSREGTSGTGGSTRLPTICGRRRFTTPCARPSPSNSVTSSSCSGTDSPRPVDRELPWHSVPTLQPTLFGSETDALENIRFIGVGAGHGGCRCTHCGVRFPSLAHADHSVDRPDGSAGIRAPTALGERRGPVCLPSHGSGSNRVECGSWRSLCGGFPGYDRGGEAAQAPSVGGRRR